MKENIKPATGRLGVLVVGVGGAVATTMITGTLAARKGLAKAIGSIAQMATMRMQDGKEHLIKDIVPLVDLNDIVFGGWDIFADDAYEAAMYAEVLKEKDLNLVKDELQAIKPMPAAFDHNFAKRLNGTHIKNAATRWDMVEQLREDIRTFKANNNCDRIAVLWAASTEIYVPLAEEHKSLAALEKAMKENNTEVISPSMCYAYAAIAEGAPFIMGAPNLCVDTPAMWEFSKKMNVPIAGKDFKSGQTLMKTVLAPMFKTRMLGVSGWFSTNILGNRDGEVLDQPENFKTKEVSKLSDLKEGSTVAIPNDASNESRALFVLQSAGLIKLTTSDSSKLVGLPDITENPHQLKFKEVDASQTPRALDSVALSVVNYNYATAASLPNSESVYMEPLNKTSAQYINFIAATSKEKNNKVYKEVAKAYASKATEKAIKEQYPDGGELPAWNLKL